jgi:hypothetical protein
MGHIWSLISNICKKSWRGLYWQKIALKHGVTRNRQKLIACSTARRTFTYKAQEPLTAAIHGYLLVFFGTFWYLVVPVAATLLYYGFAS